LLDCRPGGVRDGIRDRGMRNVIRRQEPHRIAPPGLRLSKRYRIVIVG
jgi:hypothetical protein